ncbi:hypothetical protein COU74_03305 [Candidatus Peregrinibacteria bacterium CG10_big_fil_rev_8_21_14_0_10_36_19]|nr:MAG: hypothetical protein COU74_03305 [Candidatus Peregrinibacteria bacterium CG10_big_fil_rev_8_21_14_0_10_36_19]
MDRKALVRLTHDSGNSLNLDNTTYKQWVFRYTFLELEKDLGLYGDITSDIAFPFPRTERFKIVAKSNGILAGRQEIEYFLSDKTTNLRQKLVGSLDVKFFVKEGAGFAKGDVLAEIYGEVKDILAVERTVLNLLNRMSSVATNAAKAVSISSEFDALLTPTRKTLWGLLDKRACNVGGTGTHRLNLSDAVLLKDTHLDVDGRNFYDFFVKLKNSSIDFRFAEIEVSRITEVIEVCKLFNDFNLPIVGVVMMDNMSPELINEALSSVKGMGLYDSILFEASGGINDQNLFEYAKTGVDIISMGSLTSGVAGVDISMEF